MLQNPDAMLLQIQYNNRLDNSVTSAECQRRDGTLLIKLLVKAIPDCPVAKSCSSSIPRQTT